LPSIGGFHQVWLQDKEEGLFFIKIVLKEEIIEM
jgi:hypothetical protein